jgi:hypothetical protein
VLSSDRALAFRSPSTAFLCVLARHAALLAGSQAPHQMRTVASTHARPSGGRRSEDAGSRDQDVSHTPTRLGPKWRVSKSR